MAQESNKTVIWVGVTALVIVLIMLGGFYFINANVKEANAKADAAKASADETKATVNGAVSAIQTALSTAPSATIVDDEDVISMGTSGVWTINGQYVVEYDDTCNGYNVRNSMSNFVLWKVTQYNNKMLFNAIGSEAGIDAREDILSVSIDEVGTVKTNYDPARCAVDGRVVTVPMTIKVTFEKDGSSVAYTKEYLVNAEVYDIDENFVSAAKVRINSIQRVATNYVIP